MGTHKNNQEQSPTPNGGQVPVRSHHKKIVAAIVAAVVVLVGAAGGKALYDRSIENQYQDALVEAQRLETEQEQRRTQLITQAEEAIEEYGKTLSGPGVHNDVPNELKQPMDEALQHLTFNGTLRGFNTTKHPTLLWEHGERQVYWNQIPESWFNAHEVSAQTILDGIGPLNEANQQLYREAALKVLDDFEAILPENGPVSFCGEPSPSFTESVAKAHKDLAEGRAEYADIAEDDAASYKWFIHNFHSRKSWTSTHLENYKLYKQRCEEEQAQAEEEAGADQSATPTPGLQTSKPATQTVTKPAAGSSGTSSTASKAPTMKPNPKPAATKAPAPVKTTPAPKPTTTKAPTSVKTTPAPKPTTTKAPAPVKTTPAPKPTTTKAPAPTVVNEWGGPNTYKGADKCSLHSYGWADSVASARGSALSGIGAAQVYHLTGMTNSVDFKVYTCTLD